MPVVLLSAEGATRSGHSYDDRTGVSYEYPAGKYDRYIQTGERFLYYRPGRKRMVYFGSGVIGAIRPSPTPGRKMCEILDYLEFDEPVPSKRTSG